jgi:hypothetical protein
LGPIDACAGHYTGRRRIRTKHLRALYPTSTVHEFPRDAGHASFIVRPQEFSDAIASFVENVVVKYNGDA